MPAGKLSILQSLGQSCVADIPIQKNLIALKNDVQAPRSFAVNPRRRNLQCCAQAPLPMNVAGIKVQGKHMEVWYRSVVEAMRTQAPYHSTALCHAVDACD